MSEGMQPLCDEDEFTELVEEMVTETAPSIFAVVQVYGERVDGRVAAWGMAFEDHAQVVSVEGTHRMGLTAPENALRLFSTGDNISTRLVWANPTTATGT